MVKGAERPKGSLGGKEDVRKMKGCERILRADLGLLWEGSEGGRVDLGQGCSAFCVAGEGLALHEVPEPRWGLVLSQGKVGGCGLARVLLLSCHGGFLLASRCLME